MVELTEITLEELRLYSERSSTLITIDAPLFGCVMIFNGRILHRGGTYVEPHKIGNSIGFPSNEQILAEASRFWIVDENGVRQRKRREQIAELVEQVHPRPSRGSQGKSAASG
jgi:hypothetical protein